MKEELEHSSNESEEVTPAMQKRRDFLGGLGKWSGGATIAAVGGAAWVSSPGTAEAGWLNRRHRGGGWVNGGGGGWANRRGGGGWLNRR